MHAFSDAMLMSPLLLLLLFLLCACVCAQQDHRWLYYQEYPAAGCSGAVHSIRGVRSGVCQTNLAFLSSLLAATGDALPANTSSYIAELSPDNDHSWSIGVFSSHLCANDSLLTQTHFENVFPDDSITSHDHSILPARCRAYSSVLNHSFILYSGKGMPISDSPNNAPPLFPPMDNEDSVDVLAHTPSTTPTVVPVGGAQAETETEADKGGRETPSEASLAIMCVGATILLALHAFAFSFFCCRRGIGKVSSTSSDDSVSGEESDDEVSAMESQMHASPAKRGSDDRVSVYAEG